MPLSEDAAIADVLTRARSVAIIGASDKPHRPSYGVMRALIAHGFDVYPVNPGLAGTTLLGQPVHAALADIGKPVDIVDIFRASEAAGDAVDEAIANKASAIWLQLEISNDAAVARAEAAGLRAVTDRCIKIELARLHIVPIDQ